MRAGLSLTLALAPVLLSLGFEHLSVTDRAIGEAGFTVVAYNGLRIALAAVLLACCTVAGALLRRAFFRGHSRIPSLASQLICDFAMGATFLALALIVLGFAGLLYRATAWAIASPLLAAIPFLWRMPSASPKQGLVIWILALANMAAALFLLVYRALFPSEIDGDVWEHYLHYFHEVTQRAHGLWPNDLWYHFYLSKGAVLQIFAVLLADAMAPQIVSWCFAIVSAAVAFELTRSLTRRLEWGLLASLAVLEAASIFDAAPNFLKHHMVLAGLMALLAWCVVQRLAEPETPNRPVAAAGALVAFFMAFYLPVAGAVLVSGLLAAALAALLVRRGAGAIRSMAIFGAAASVGILAVLSINYLVTGLALDSPVGLFWRLADKERFGRLWSPLVVEYWFLGTGAVESASPSLFETMLPKLGWLREILRLHYLPPLGWLVALAIAMYAVRAISRRRWLQGEPGRAGAAGLIVLVAFSIGTLALANAFPGSNSVYRFYAFALVLVLIAGTAVTGVLFELAALAPVVRSLFVLTCAIAMSVVLLGHASKDRVKLVSDYALGKLPTRQVLTLNDTYSGLPGGFADFEAAKRAAPRGRILYMGYSPSPGYLLPPPPLLSEPSYAFGNRYGEILYGPADEARAALQAQDINYFLINMRSRLFLGIPYSELFDASNIAQRLGLHWSRNEFYMLTWKSSATRPLPPEFIAMLEFKQRSVFARLKAELGPRFEESVRSSPGTLTDRSALKILERYLLGKLKTDEARSFVRAFVSGNAGRPGSLVSRGDSAARAAEKVSLTLRDFAAARWGEPIAMDMWNLRLSEDIQSQDFGWLYERNRSRYTGAR